MERCLNCMEIYDEQYEVCPHCGYVRGSDRSIPFALKPGTLLKNRYIVGTVIGHGGFGITYRGWDTVLSTKIAIKEYYPSGLATRSPGTGEIRMTRSDGDTYLRGMDKFLQEARTLASFNQKRHIVHVYDYLKENRTAYIVMEYIEGISLKQYAKEKPEGRLPYDEAVTICYKIIQALSTVHAAGKIHRDISPDNIMIKGSDITLLDFGAARQAVADDGSGVSIILKKEYAPPEQFSSTGTLDRRADLFALGVVLYRLITGRLPQSSVDRMTDDQVPPPSTLADCPKWLDDVVMKAISIDMDSRYQTAFDFGMDLMNKTQNTDKQEEQPAPPPSQPVKPTAGKKKISVGFVMAAMVIVVYVATNLIPMLTGDSTADRGDSSYVSEETEEAGPEPQPMPKNGAVLYNTKKGSSTSEFTITNRKELPCLLMLKVPDKDTIVYEGFIAAGYIATFDIPHGTYDIEYVFGDTWYGTGTAFREERAYSSYALDEKFEYGYYYDIELTD